MNIMMMNKDKVTPGLYTAAMETPDMTRKLKAAEPTIVEAPSLPGSSPRVDTVSITESKISGALNM